MGFLYRRLNFADNSTGSNYNVFYDFTIRTQDATNCYYRSACAVNSMAAALKDMNVGWDIDTSYGFAWADDPSHEGCKIVENDIAVPVMVYPTDKGCGLIMKNSISGCQLFISYLCASNGSGIDLPAEQVAKAYGANGSYVSKNDPDKPSYVGFVFSMIPGDSTQRFGSFSDGTFIPSQATQVSGLCMSTRTTTGGSADSMKTSYLRASLTTDHTGKKFSYGILATPCCVVFCANHGDTENYPEHLILCEACGKIFGGLMHDENLPQSKYGILYLALHPGSQSGKAFYERGNGLIDGTDYQEVTNPTNFDGTNEYTYGTGSFVRSVDYTNLKSKNLANIFNASGNALARTANRHIRVEPDPYQQLSHNISSDEAGIMWCPYLVGVVSNNLQEDGIIPGNGMKGYLDTDLFRCARVPYGTTLCDGKFLSVGYNLVIGWDPSNQAL